jgi:hypothetical protein
MPSNQTDAESVPLKIAQGLMVAAALSERTAIVAALRLTATEDQAKGAAGNTTFSDLLEAFASAIQDREPPEFEIEIEEVELSPTRH